MEKENIDHFVNFAFDEIGSVAGKTKNITVLNISSSW